MSLQSRNAQNLYSLRFVFINDWRVVYTSMQHKWLVFSMFFNFIARPNFASPFLGAEISYYTKVWVLVASLDEIVVTICQFWRGQSCSNRVVKSVFTAWFRSNLWMDGNYWMLFITVCQFLSIFKPLTKADKRIAKKLYNTPKCIWILAAGK